MLQKDSLQYQDRLVSCSLFSVVCCLLSIFGCSLLMFVLVAVGCLLLVVVGYWSLFLVDGVGFSAVVFSVIARCWYRWCCFLLVFVLVMLLVLVLVLVLLLVLLLVLVFLS